MLCHFHVVLASLGPLSFSQSRSAPTSLTTPLACVPGVLPAPLPPKCDTLTSLILEIKTNGLSVTWEAQPPHPKPLDAGISVILL